jgi:hypothetical protein
MDIKTEKIIDILDIRKFFPNVDKDLITLAITPSGQRISKVPSGVDKKFANYESLEFYGDSVLDFLIVDEVETLFGLNISPGDLTRIKQQIVKNDSLTGYSADLKVCRILGVRDISRLKKHNICADSFEAIIGALYIQYGIRNLLKIQNWLRSLGPLTEEIDRLLVEQVRNEDVTDIFPGLKFTSKKKSNSDQLNDFISAYAEKYPKIGWDEREVDDLLELFMDKATSNDVIEFPYLVADRELFALDHETFVATAIKNLKKAGVWV